MTKRGGWWFAAPVLLLCAAPATGCGDDDSGEPDDGGNDAADVEAESGADADADVGSDADADADADAGADADADTDADDDGGDDAGCEPPPAPPVVPLRGQVRVTARDLGTSSSIDGSAVFATPAALVWHEEVMREGDCRLLHYDSTGCTEPCWDGVCRGGVCEPFPTYQGAGTVTLTGLGSGTLTLADYGAGTYYGYLPDTSLVAGAAVGVQATGGEFPAFSIDGVQPALLEATLTTADELDLVNGVDNVVRWTAADYCGSRIRLQLKTPTAAHGLPPVWMIECDVPDTGSLTIPRALVEAFPETERREICVLIDCPPSVMTRYTRAVGGAAGAEAELVVESNLTFYLVHPAP
ncbi:MAG: hypothetical protein JXB32_08605 [Deltaproteobacteria bacterium]|nr:hypothetical protein [Deltaproteobacteria bacterium]